MPKKAKSRTTKSSLKKYSPIIALSAISGVLVVAGLGYLAVMPHRPASAEEYPVKGFDVSIIKKIFNGQKFHLKNTNSFISKPRKVVILKIENFKITGYKRGKTAF